MVLVFRLPEGCQQPPPTPKNCRSESIAQEQLCVVQKVRGTAHPIESILWSDHPDSTEAKQNRPWTNFLGAIWAWFDSGLIWVTT
jgi:hypothetical protein